MRTIFALLTLSFLVTQLSGQQYFELTENEAMDVEGLSASYNSKFIKTTKNQDIYEITVSVRNEGGTILDILPEIGTFADPEDYRIASFSFENATGKGLSARKLVIDPHPFKSTVVTECQNCNYEAGDDSDDKYIEKSKRMIVAYGIREGQLLKNVARVRVPVGEEPQVSVQFQL